MNTDSEQLSIDFRAIRLQSPPRIQWARRIPVLTIEELISAAARIGVQAFELDRARSISNTIWFAERPLLDTQSLAKCDVEYEDGSSGRLVWWTQWEHRAQLVMFEIATTPAGLVAKLGGRRSLGLVSCTGALYHALRGNAYFHEWGRLPLSH